MAKGKKITERRMERLRPEQFKKLRKNTPLAYLPLGILEWHGPQNPMGLDGVKAHALCLRAANRTGGIVFPTLYYGPPAASHYLDTDHYHSSIPKSYGLPAKNFAVNAFGFGSRIDQWQLFNQVLDQSLRQTARYGFEAVLVLAGHYPLARASLTANSFEREFGIPVFLGHEGQLATPPDGDHAAQWETSLTWQLEPDTVDSGKFPGKGKPNPPGVMGKPVADITPKLAQANLKRALDGIVDMGNALLARRRQCRAKLKSLLHI